MIVITKIQVQNMCKHHSLPFVYMCITKYCNCQVKLCQKCHTEHEAQNQNSNLMKIDNFVSKIQTQVDISIKQAQKLTGQHCKTPLDILQSQQKQIKRFLANQVQILQDSMKYLNEESKKVQNQIKLASQEITARMENIQIKRKQLPLVFCKKVLDNKLCQTLITFYSQSGFTNFRKKLDKSLQFRRLVKDFIEYANKFGKKYEQFMKTSTKSGDTDLSMKNTIKQISKGKYNINGQQNKEYLQFRQGTDRKNNLANNQEPKREKRAKTIFGRT